MLGKIEGRRRRGQQRMRRLDGITDGFSVKLEAMGYVNVLILVTVHNGFYVVKAEPDRVKKNGNVNEQNTYNEGCWE